MSCHHSSGSSGHSSMDQTQEELEALHPQGLLTTEVPKLPQTNTENWIHMSLLQGLEERKELWTGYRGVGSDSGLGQEESVIGVGTQRDQALLLPEPPSYWKFAILITIVNPPLGILALFMCHLTQKDVDRGRLLRAKRRSRQTVILIIVAFSITVLALVLFVVVLTARNEYPFRLEPIVTERLKPNKHGLNLDYVPPDPVKINTDRSKSVEPPPPYKPPPFKPRPLPPVEDVLGDLARKWEAVNATTFDFAQHDDVVRFLEGFNPSNSTYDPH